MGKIASILAVFLSGCTTYGGSFCDNSKAIRPDAKDVEVISNSLTNQLTAHNEKGAGLCGWKP